MRDLLPENFRVLYKRECPEQYSSYFKQVKDYIVNSNKVPTVELVKHYCKKANFSEEYVTEAYPFDLLVDPLAFLRFAAFLPPLTRLPN